MEQILDLKNGCNKTFKQVFDQYHAILYRYVFNKTKSDYFSQEIVQEVFFKLWKYRGSLNEDIPLNAQIFRIAKTLLINELKTSYNKQNFTSILEYNPPSVNGTSESIFHTELQQNLYHIVNNFPPVRKRVFEMSRFECLTYKEISQELNISIKTVENHINLALKHLKPLLTSLIVLILFG